MGDYPQTLWQQAALLIAMGMESLVFCVFPMLSTSERKYSIKMAPFAKCLKILDMRHRNFTLAVKEIEV